MSEIIKSKEKVRLKRRYKRTKDFRKKEKVYDDYKHLLISDKRNRIPKKPTIRNYHEKEE